jgi:iron(III) transport system permease protein
MTGAATVLPGRPVAVRGSSGHGIRLLSVTAVVLAAVLFTPVAVVLGMSLGANAGNWQHLFDTVLGEYVVNTAVLLLLVTLGAGSIGVTSAWLVSAYRFPGRGVLEWALVLPLAMPAYVIAYAYTDFLQFAGPVQSFLRRTMEWNAGDYWFPEIRSLGGAAVMFSFVLYPYVYLLARTAFLEQSANLAESGRLLGLSSRRNFLRVGLPLARPAIAAGISLALMETLADFGTVSYFAVPTISVGIYRAWLSLGDSAAAAQLASLLLLFVAMVLVVERLYRGTARFHQSASRRRRGMQLTGRRCIPVVVLCVLPIGFGFVLPACILLQLSLGAEETQWTGRLVDAILNTVTVAAIASLAAIVLAVLIAYAARLSRHAVVRWAHAAVGLGYAIPGAVIAVGVLIPVGRLDNWLADLLQSVTGTDPGLLLTGGVAALVYAYLVRFLAVALQSVDSGLGRIRPNMEDAARSLGHAPAQVLARVHVPMLRGSLLTALLIVFVDVMKELPATFMMRPFNFETLAVRAFNFAADERLAEAASASLVIALVGLVPLVILARRISRGQVV